jgi:hypothetical protein
LTVAEEKLCHADISLAFPGRGWLMSQHSNRWIGRHTSRVDELGALCSPRCLQIRGHQHVAKWTRFAPLPAAGLAGPDPLPVGCCRAGNLCLGDCPIECRGVSTGQHPWSMTGNDILTAARLQASLPGLVWAAVRRVSDPYPPKYVAQYSQAKFTSLAQTELQAASRQQMTLRVLKDRT